MATYLKNNMVVAWSSTTDLLVGEAGPCIFRFYPPSGSFTSFKEGSGSLSKGNHIIDIDGTLITLEYGGDTGANAGKVVLTISPDTPNISQDDLISLVFEATPAPKV